jgi:molecular chaperone DnaK (HSP70)
MILSWPAHGREEGKAPTAIYYDDNYEVKWGYDISDEVTPLQWFKLLLLRNEDLPEEVQQSNALLAAKRMLKESGKSAVDVIADYLRVLWKHIISTIYKERTQLIIDQMKLHVVLTVPAIWQGYTRQAMREAAKKAGIMDERPSGPTTLSFAPEPEAAAMATMCENDRLLQDDDVYILCDAGGGTVVGTILCS